ncbi:MAG TPA: xanthine dehydrogenase family protein molybdopterin-binding subunit [Stellaceae bacterium]
MSATMVIGQGLSRVDGPAKVTGAAKYAAEFAMPGLVHGVIVSSTTPKGRIVSIDTRAAEAAPGVLAVITHENAVRLPYAPMKERPQVDPQAGEPLHVLQGAEVFHSGQHIAVVIAETREQAAHGADLVRVDYAEEPPQTSFGDAAARGEYRPDASQEKGKAKEEERGDDADAAFAAAPVKVDATYVHAREYHNAMELHATVAAWDGDRLTLWDKTQWVDNDRKEVAHAFGIPEDRIRVISPFVGGAFGSALRTWPHVMLTALAAKQVGRPVRVELTRRQCYYAIGFRPHTEQHMRLGADGDGRLTALINETEGQTSTYEEYAENTLQPSQMLYSCPNVRTNYRLVPMNVNTPCPMRAPGVVTGAYALECAMDELAWAAGVDPVELRLRNYAESDEHKKLPWSSKGLRECYRVGAERFGWSRRQAQPGAMRDGGKLVGYGMASAVYPTQRSPAHALARILADGTAEVLSASSDMGPGTYTSMTQVAAETLDLPPSKVRFALGDTDMPPAPVHGGSITMASVGSAVQAACRAVREKLAAVAGNTGAPPSGADYAELLRRAGKDAIEATAESKPGDETKQFSMYVFGAIFAEVRIDPDLCEIRVPRLVGAYASGRIINPKTARSQCIGGMVQGIGMALLEGAEWDERFGRVMNGNLAEYLVPVNADVPSLDVTFVDEHDPHVNPLGVKGLAEIAIVGVAPAIANAVFHATGRRFRDLPIRPEHLLLS